jgi:hypothetical protein
MYTIVYSLYVTSTATCIPISVYPSCTACLRIFFLKMFSLSIYRYIFVSAGQCLWPSFNTLSFYILVYSIFSFHLVCYSYLCFPISSFVCRSAFCLCLQELLIFSCLFIFVFYIIYSAFYLYPPLSIVCYSMIGSFWCGSKTIALLYSTVYTYLLPGHLVGTEDDADPASPFYIVIPALSE